VQGKTGIASKIAVSDIQTVLAYIHLLILLFLFLYRRQLFIYLPINHRFCIPILQGKTGVASKIAGADSVIKTVLYYFHI